MRGSKPPVTAPHYKIVRFWPFYNAFRNQKQKPTTPTQINMASTALVEVDVQGKLEKLASGKVRDLFYIDGKTLLFVASDRISAYDVIMNNVSAFATACCSSCLLKWLYLHLNQVFFPTMTEFSIGYTRQRRTAHSDEVRLRRHLGFDHNTYLRLSIYWFHYLQSKISNLETHYISNTLPPALDSVSQSIRESLQPRSMQVRRLQVFAIESIVRGYITGSGWAEYKKSGTVCGIQMPTGLIEGQKLEKPLWTPSTKAEVGGKDENISPAEARKIVGEKYAKEIERLSLECYFVAAQRAEEVGIILADTKFEFALDADADKVVLVDEVLTPDSSRFWPKDTWEENLGKAQPSFDKQFLRDWLTKEGLKDKKGVEVPDEVVKKTAEKYKEAYEKLTGENLKAT
jgi:phosphoribosylaminoimidazole-succinocarboxamide synthase